VREHLLADARVRRAPRVALYAALGDEVPTRPLFEALAEVGCVRLLPRVGAGGLEFAPVDAWEALRRGPFGVLAPPERSLAVALDPADVALLPGVAFDTAGHRLGRGGGHYDRAFADPRSSPLLVGVAFRVQIVAAVPYDSRDRAVDAIVTEDGLRRAGASGWSPVGESGSP